MANRNHLIVPFASSLDASCQAAIKTLAVPNLTRLLKCAKLVHEDHGDEFDFSLPHERVWRQANTHEDSQPPVTLTLCHWTVGIDRISMNNPEDLVLSEEESRTLFEVVSPYFLEDGIALSYVSALHWQATGDTLNSLDLASLDRVIGRNVDVWQPLTHHVQTTHNKAIRRLQNEVQMLLYTHPINTTREARGLPTVNSFWLSRPMDFAKSILGTRFDDSLRRSALAGDWKSWSNAWQATDDKAFQALWLESQSPQGLADDTRFTLCGERHAKTYAITPPRSLWAKAQRLVARQPNSHEVLASL